MKPIAAIGIENERGQIAMFRDVEVFNKFRATLWPEGPPGLPLLLEWTAQHLLERGLEDRFQLPRNSLLGTCLIFGTREELTGRLANPEARDIVFNRETEVIIKITTADSQVRSVTKLGPNTYNFTYPAEQALIPQGTPLFPKYFEFAADRFHDIEGEFMMVY